MNDPNPVKSDPLSDGPGRAAPPDRTESGFEIKDSDIGAGKYGDIPHGNDHEVPDSVVPHPEAD